ncbi:hypothetical protein [Motilibacter aurantiacus]|uniref:hypothetical protein n=1 Tax=Motilibacter aurantiacus TaxID=2714955 RepID=UPI00140A2A84|nr:hypothetical protein [Motilibacter aurantiacus]NHC43823.1 hypothetical protein [Motilibacter aurantiacus]
MQRTSPIVSAVLDFGYYWPFLDPAADPMPTPATPVPLTRRPAGPTAGACSAAG